MSLKKISDLFHFEKGSLQSSKCTPGEYDFITASAVWKTHNAFSHDCEALIFAAAASGSLGRTHYVNGKFISSDLCFIITPKYPEKLPIDLKFYHLIFQAFKDEIVRNTKSGTSKEAIGLRVFGKYQLPYFDIEKQIEVKKKFVNTQSSTIGLSTELTHQLDTAKKLRQAFLREAMQGKLTADWRKQNPNVEPATELLAKIKAEKEQLIKEKKIRKQKPLPPITQEEIPFEIPENWVWCRLGEICDTITKGSSPKWQGVKYVNSIDEGILFITSKNVDSYKIDLSNSTFVEEKFNEIEPRSILQKGDILTNIVGASIGRTAIYDLDYNANINQAVCILRYEHNYLLKDYLLKLMNSDFIIQLMLEMQFSPGRANLSMSNLSKFPIGLPPLSEQKAIVAKLDELMAYCDSLEENIKNSQTQNEMLLQQVLREALEPKKEAIV